MTMERSRIASRTSSLGGGGDFLTPQDDAGGFVTISHVPHEERVAAAGMTVAQVRARYRDRFDIDPRSQAFIDGSAVSDDTALRAGQNLMFMRHSGEKGAGRGPQAGEGGAGGWRPEGARAGTPGGAASRRAERQR